MADRSLTQCILVPLDGSDFATIALPYLRATATPVSEVLLVQIVQWPMPIGSVVGTAPLYYDEALIEAPRAAAEAYLKDLAEAISDPTVNITRLTRTGMPADEILAIAKERDASLIIMATRGRGALGRALLGSVADRVARAAEVPVLLVHPEREEVPAAIDRTAAIRRLVVPLDGSAP